MSAGALSPPDRKCFKVGRGLYRMDQVIQVQGEQAGYDATGPYWIAGLIEILSGQLWFIVDDRKVEAPGSFFIMAMPPRSVVSVVLKDALTINAALFSRSAALRHLPTEPIAFAVAPGRAPATLAELEVTLKDASNGVPISRCSRPHVLSRRLKDHLSEHFTESTPLPTLARRLNSSASVLSRTFRKDWGKPPIHFRNWLRILDSFRHLSEDTAVIDTALEVGFNDLSRFHKQFKGTVGHSPLSIRNKSKNARKR